MGNQQAQVGASSQDSQLNNANYSTTYSQPLDPNVYGSAFQSTPSDPAPMHIPPPLSYTAAVQQQPEVATPEDMTAAVSFLSANPQLCQSYAANVGNNPAFIQTLLQQNPEFAKALAQNPQFAVMLGQNPQLTVMLGQNSAPGVNAQFAALLAAAAQQPTLVLPPNMTPLPTPVQCPHCNTSVTTVTTKEAGPRAYMQVAVCTLALCCLGLLFAALFWEQFKDTVHTCPNCKRELGRHVPRGSGGRRGRRRGGIGRRGRRGGRR